MMKLKQSLHFLIIFLRLWSYYGLRALYHPPMPFSVGSKPRSFLGKETSMQLYSSSGLNLNREIGTHFSQESLFTGSMKLARKLHLPLILHVVDLNSLEKAVELLLAEEEVEDHSTLSLIIYDVVACTGAEESLRRLLLEELATDKRYAVSYVITGVGITAEGEEESLRSKAFVAALPVESLLVATDAPWKTPQNLPDTYLKTLRNESANIESIVEAMAAAKTMEVTEMAKVLKENSLRVFGLESLSTLPFNVHKDGEEEEESEDEEQGISDEEKGAVAAKTKKNERDRAESLEKGVKELILHEKDKTGKKGKKHDSTKTADTTTESTTKASAKKPGEESSSLPIDIVASNPTSAREYKCVKCRSKLFTSLDITTHQYGAAKTVFKVGEEGLCASFCFVPAAEGREIHKRLGLQIRGGNVECSKCGMKLGKYSPGEALCGCGVALAGPIAKINANKIDLSDQTVDTQELAERLKLESEQVQRQLEMEDAESQVRLQQKLAASKAKKVKKHKAENRGNFSNYRNKSFIPNASKVRKGQEGNEEGDHDNEGELEEEDDHDSEDDKEEEL